MLKCKETVTAALYAAQILDSEMLKYNTEQTHTTLILYFGLQQLKY